MFIAVVVLHTLLCMAIIGIVLLQAGKGADIGSAFGGAGSQAVFGSMGTPTVLGKITTAVAVLFLATSFSLALLGSRARHVGHPRGPGQGRSRRAIELEPGPVGIDPGGPRSACEVRAGSSHGALEVTHRPEPCEAPPRLARSRGGSHGSWVGPGPG